MSRPARNLSVVTSSPLGASEARVGRSPTGCAEGHATEGRSSRSEPVGRKSAKPTAKPTSKTVAIRVVRTKASKRRIERFCSCADWSSRNARHRNRRTPCWGGVIDSLLALLQSQEHSKALHMYGWVPVNLPQHGGVRSTRRRLRRKSPMRGGRS
jgi:hypothetical protein